MEKIKSIIKHEKFVPYLCMVPFMTLFITGMFVWPEFGLYMLGIGIFVSFVYGLVRVLDLE